jgi:hypothetical protein
MSFFTLEVLSGCDALTDRANGPRAADRTGSWAAAARGDSEKVNKSRGGRIPGRRKEGSEAASL